MKLLLVTIATLKILVNGASAYAVAPSQPADHELTAACPYCFPDPPPPNNC